MNFFQKLFRALDIWGNDVVDNMTSDSQELRKQISDLKEKIPESKKMVIEAQALVTRLESEAKDLKKEAGDLHKKIKEAQKQAAIEKKKGNINEEQELNNYAANKAIRLQTIIDVRMPKLKLQLTKAMGQLEKVRLISNKFEDEIQTRIEQLTAVQSDLKVAEQLNNITNSLSDFGQESLGGKIEGTLERAHNTIAEAEAKLNITLGDIGSLQVERKIETSVRRGNAQALLDKIASGEKLMLEAPTGETVLKELQAAKANATPEPKAIETGQEDTTKTLAEETVS